MMKRNVVVGSCLAIVLGAVGCQEQSTAPVRAELAVQPAGTSGIAVDRGAVRLPASARLSDPFLSAADARAINPSDYECTPGSPVTDWWLAEVMKTVTQEPDIFKLLYSQLAADYIPVYEAILFQTDDTPQRFGYNGEYDKIMLKTERDIKRFWDIPSADIQLLGMHGDVLLDVERTARTYVEVFGLKPETAMLYAKAIREALLKSKTLNGGNHPLFTFNAVAFSTDDGSIPDKIVMGDGILAGYAAVGLGDVAPQAIYAHEFAHQIQFENGYFDDKYATTGSEAEQTRYTELMADAMSAYYLTHARGGAMNRKRVEQFLEVFFQIGDCGFTDGGHHGTPNQRMAAARFGFEVADQAKKQGHILTAEQFYQLFYAKYPQLIAPDAK